MESKIASYQTLKQMISRLETIGLSNTQRFALKPIYKLIAEHEEKMIRRSLRRFVFFLLLIAVLGCGEVSRLEREFTTNEARKVLSIDDTKGVDCEIGKHQATVL